MNYSDPNENGKELKLWSDRNKQDTVHLFHHDDSSPRPMIDYAKLNWLCNHEGLQKKLSGASTEEAHAFFMEHYQEVFVDTRPQAGIPLTAKDLEATKPPDDGDISSYSDCSKTHFAEDECADETTHDIKFHMAKLHKERKIMDPDILFANKIKDLRSLSKKMPYERTADDIKQLHTHLKSFTQFSKQVSNKELRELCTAVQQDIWRDENYTVFTNTGFYIILRGSVTPVTRPWLKFRGQPHPSSMPSIVTPHSESSSGDADLRDVELTVGDCFGTLERVDGPEPNSRILCVETKTVPCEFLKIHSNDFKRITEHIIEHEISEKIELIQACRAYNMWPRQSLQRLAELLEWTKFPENTVLVSEGFLCPFMVFIKTGECHVLQEVRVKVTLPNGDKKWKRKQVVVGQMRGSESFGEVSVLKGEPISSSVVTATQVEVGIITLEKLEELDETTKSLLLQSNERLYKPLTEDQIHDEYISQEQKRQWNQFKHGVLEKSIQAKGIRPGHGKWAK